MQVKLLTTRNATDRLISAVRHLDRHGIIPDVVYALEDSDPKRSFNRSMKHIMETSSEMLMLFEDDILLKENNHIDKAISQLPKDWDLCYLGANIIGPVERYSDNLFRIYGAWTTHAVIYRNPQEIGKAYNDTSYMFDAWLNENIVSKGNSYIISPMVAWQVVHKSDLWGHIADYTRIFDDSANKLV